MSAGSAQVGLLPEDTAEGSGRLYRLLVAAGSAQFNLRAGGAVKQGGAKSSLWTQIAVKDAGDSPNEVRFVDAGNLGH